MSEQCANCGNPDAEAYDLLVQSATTEIHLCEECYTGLEEEFVWTH